MDMNMIHRNLKVALCVLPWLGLAALLLVPVLWAVFYIGLYLGYGNYKNLGHQAFAANGVAQIEPASQMAQSFDGWRNCHNLRSRL